MYLLLQFYKSHNKERQKELNECLINNTAKNFITNVILFLEGEGAQEIYNNLTFEKKKILTILINKQLTYKDFFEYANNNLQDKIVVLIHSDILLCSGFEKIKKKFLYKRLLAVARHTTSCTKLDGHECCKDNSVGIYLNNSKKNLLFYCGGGFDTYVFCPPINNMIISQLDYTQNTWTGENILVQLFKTYGYDVTSPIELVTRHNDNLGQIGDSPTSTFFTSNNKFQYAFPDKYFTVGTSYRNRNFFTD